MAPPTTDDPAPFAGGSPPEGASLLRRIQGSALPDPARVETALVAEEEASRHRRRITSSLPPRDHVLPVPNGWYGLLGSDQLGRRDIVSLRAFDRDLVAFRDEEGRARVLDAHCAHLGAHLGGGRVVGETIRCPYHGWRYGGDGRCVEIPYSDARIPARACVRSYRTDEKDGFVYAWYHAADAAPTYEIPTVAEVDDPEWTGAHVFELDLVATLQEMAENNVDYAHFRYVHGRDAVPIDLSQLHLDGPCSTVEESLGEGLSFSRHSYGPGVAVLRFPSIMTFIACTTPIDRGTCRLRWHFHFPAPMAPAADDLIRSVVGPYGLEADVPIWRDMAYRERPVLVKGDGPISEYRRWYAQFYEGAERAR